MIFHSWHDFRTTARLGQCVCCCTLHTTHYIRTARTHRILPGSAAERVISIEVRISV